MHLYTTFNKPCILIGMEKKYKKALHIFRRDLRLKDNTALNEALKHAEEVTLVFILDPRQASKENPYRGEHFLQFMQESLQDLAQEVEKRGGVLHVYEGEVERVLPGILKEHEAEAIFYNKDYTPFSLKRDVAMQSVAQKMAIGVHGYDDALLCTPGTVLTGSGKPYSVFTPFYRAALAKEIAKPVPLHAGTFTKGKKPDIRLVVSPKNLAVRGGAMHVQKILKRLDEFRAYKTQRDMPNEDGTTKLSAYIKLGCVSVREVYCALREKLPHTHEPLTRQLFWRDFFTHITFFHPDVLGSAFRTEYDKVTWNEPGEAFERWKEGKTGFPIVDAGMRQLNETGWMHNRVRMITASFLVKDLHIDWREGEKYFAQKLVDYDPAVNNGSWQWVAGTGADAAPYFRIFNPWLQQKKFDPECGYIKKWVPELRDVSARDIHNWEEVSQSLFAAHAYPVPMVNHREEAEETKHRFGKVKKL